jgi:hypothetical protein
MWLVIRAASTYQQRDYSGIKHHAKVHTFRFATAVATWLLIIAAFYYHPEWIKWGLRTITHGIETVADALPYPWGDRIEIALRNLQPELSLIERDRLKTTTRIVSLCRTQRVRPVHGWWTVFL